MKPNRKLLPVILLFCSFTSCIITDYSSSLQVEIMKPGVFNIPQDVKTVAIINLNIDHPDSSKFSNFYGPKIVDILTTKCPDRSNNTLDALDSFLVKERYFAKVINYKNSLDSLWTEQPLRYSKELFEKTKADMCIFLENFDLCHTMININYYRSLQTKAHLIWGIVFKSDSTFYTYNQIDTLVYKGNQFPQYFNCKNGLDNMTINSSEYLGNYFGTKIIPSWLTVERLYYKSKNQTMLRAEKYAMDNNWLKAAEMWRKESNNKNSKIAAKACYNMALACEMEGKLDLSIDWLIKSYSVLPKNNEEHRANCQRYINVLVLRKKEIEKLDKQVRN